jgi:hypothetical protein
MRTIFCALPLLVALTAVAADQPELPPADKTAPEGPPCPPPVTWIVTGYKAVGSQWVKQLDHCLKTTDLKRAGQYEAEIMRFQNWLARSNVPVACSPTPTQWESPSDMPTPDCPARPTFVVWAFHLQDGTWVKDEKYCWTADDNCSCRIDALAYAAKVNTVPGWRATTNAPEAMYAHADEKIPFHGPLGWTGYSAASGYHARFSAGGAQPVDDGDDRGNFLGYSRGGYPMYSEHGGRTIYRPHMIIRLGADAAAHSNDDDWARQQWESDQRQNEINDQLNRDIQQMNQDLMNQALQNITPPN